ncbi:unnamed protein product [Rotaria sp. Silwood2]|nr:unnamed protein product [Rotaria sp. Silwood2]CAF3031310.1 unnamed protein product [Rotaria sp. Silwood2]CAF4345583.1 unnamed protein product [Rotaria sp. Silwood2]CAF4513169.1 unnamed protein product [Rotaria sp. Silwood2]
MTKIVIFVALICATISSPLAPKFDQSQSFHNFFNKQIWSSKLCQDITLAQTYLTNIQQFITSLEGNDTYAQVLEKRANAIAYFKNADNETISSNCTQFFIGLKNARKLDTQVLIKQLEYEEYIRDRYKQIIQLLVGTHSRIDDDF